MNKELEREVDYLKGNMEDAIRGIENFDNGIETLENLWNLLNEVEASIANVNHLK